MGKRAHCEVFRRHRDVPPFFSLSQPSSEDPSQPSLQREGVVKQTNTSAVNNSPLSRGAGGVL